MVAAFESHSTIPVLFPPDRQAATRRLQTFLPHVAAYARERNYDRPGHREVSRLSPYLRHRLLTEGEVVDAVLDRTSYREAEKFILEVCWRSYCKGFLELHPSVWKSFRNSVVEEEARLGRQEAERLQAARNGQTGIACYDAWVRELLDTGYLHNHARMWFASIWIFTLRLPWSLGAAFFLQHLLDGDPASNTLGWRWVAGLHTQGKNYLARAENIRKYTDGRFYPSGQLREQAPPLEPQGSHPQVGLAPVARGWDLTSPDLSTCPAGLLVLPEDLSPEGSQLGDAPFSSICLFEGRDIETALMPSARVQSFREEAYADAVKRIAEHWSAKTVPIQGQVETLSRKACADNVGCYGASMRLYHGKVDRWAESVAAWARSENLNSVWMLQPPVGPWRDAMPRLRSALRPLNVTIFENRRRWDQLHWRHATGGFFSFKKNLESRINGYREGLLPFA